MGSRARFRVNTPDVTHEVIDGEAVIINLVTGNYYSLDKAGADVWILLERNVAVESIIEHIAFRYEGGRSAIEKSVVELISRLRDEELIVPDSTSGPAKSSETEVPSAGNGARPSFQPPVLLKFTDMQELLLLDPIHEVDQTGWPHKKTDTPV
jgi:hypothetical protein